MKLHVLGSNSAGNSYLLETHQGEVLMLEAGINFSLIKQDLGFRMDRITACLVTHAHKDHSKSIKEVLKAGITVVGPQHVYSQLDAISAHRYFIAEPGIKTYLGSFEIIPVDVRHDVPCVAYLIRHLEMGTTCFITDTFYVPYTFPGLNNVIVECNYSRDILERNILNGSLNAMVMKRVCSSHMELQTCKDFLKANDLSAVNNIVLIHLSDGNSNAERFQREVQEQTGKTVHVADKGMTINFDKTPF